MSCTQKAGQIQHGQLLVSLLSIISKVIEGIINSAIKQHLVSNNLLSDAQFGFCQGHSAPDLITTLVQIWTKVLNFRGESDSP